MLLWFRQILFNLAIAAIVEAMLMRISAKQVPSFHSVAPRCLKLITSSSFWLFTSIMAIHGTVNGNICSDIVRAAGRNFALFCADFHSIRPSSVHKSVGIVLKFANAATHGYLRVTEIKWLTLSAQGKRLCGQTTVNRSKVNFIWNGLQIAKICCLYLDIFSCVKINVFRSYFAFQACQMR